MNKILLSLAASLILGYSSAQSEISPISIPALHLFEEEDCTEKQMNDHCAIYSGNELVLGNCKDHHSTGILECSLTLAATQQVYNCQDGTFCSENSHPVCCSDVCCRYDLSCNDNA